MSLDSLDKLLRMNRLFAFYQKLLTDKQQMMLALYYEEDYSLSEIAEHYNISRQAVHDNLKRAEKLLEQYEEKLHLLERQQCRSGILRELIQRVSHDSVAQEMLNILMKMDE